MTQISIISAQALQTTEMLVGLRGGQEEVVATGTTGCMLCTLKETRQSRLDAKHDGSIDPECSNRSP